MVQTLQDLTILLLVSLPINILFHRVKLPSIMGFLVAGMLIGPHGLELIGDPQSVENLSEIGVILLLFLIGLEFSLSHMVKKWAAILVSGGLQLGLTAGAGYGICLWLGFPPNQALALGLLAALSSTAVVMKMITDRVEIDTLHGRVCIGILLFQDVCVVPMMLVIPLLVHSGDISALDFGIAMIKSLAAVAAIFFLSRLLVPRALGAIARLGSKEHLTLLVILIIMGTGWVSHHLGLTLAMGAFIAGLIISDSEYSHQIILDILPLKDYFGSIFFISLGMLLQTDLFFAEAGLYLGLAAGLIGLKIILTWVASWGARNSFRISFIVGLRLAQVGEFSLILASLALELGLFDNPLYQSFLIVAILSLLAAPVLIQVSSGLSFLLFSGGGKPADEVEPASEKSITDHVIIVGYSLVGRNLSHVLKEINIPFQVVVLDGEMVKQALTEKVPVLYGDSTQSETLHRAGLCDAKLIVVTIPDYKACQQVVGLARKLNPDIYILVRTQFASQMDELTKAGANQVIPEEFETSVEIFSRVLREFKIPNNVIEQQVELVRLGCYSMFRGLSLNTDDLKKFSTYLTASLSKSFQVLGNSWSLGQRLDDLQLTAQTGATLIAVVRNNQVQPNPEKDFQIETGDVLILFGRHAPLDRAERYLATGPSPGSAPSGHEANEGDITHDAGLK